MFSTQSLNTLTRNIEIKARNALRDFLPMNTMRGLSSFCIARIRTYQNNKLCYLTYSDSFLRREFEIGLKKY